MERWHAESCNKQSKKTKKNESKNIKHGPACHPVISENNSANSSTVHSLSLSLALLAPTEASAPCQLYHHMITRRPATLYSRCPLSLHSAYGNSEDDGLQKA